VRDQVYALALSRNAALMTARPKTGPGPSFLAAYSKSDGKILWKVNLPVEPRLGGLALDRHGRALVTLQDGSILCVGG
jgi:hypothetical protein